MKRIVKLFVAGFSGLVVLLFVSGYLVIRSLDGMSKRAIQQGGTHVLGVETRVDSADIGVFAGTFRMTGLDVSNPKGYTSSHFLRLPSAGVDVSLGTLMKDTIRIPKLAIGRLDINLDGSGGQANYKQILEHIKKLETGGEGGGSSGEGKKFVIDEITIEGATVRLVELGGLSQAVGEVKVDVPQIRLEGVGTKEPMGLEAIVSLIVKTVLSTTVEAGGGIIPAEVLGDLQGQLAGMLNLQDLGITATGGVGEIAGQIQDEAQRKIDEAAEQLGDQLDDAAGKIGDRLKGLGDGQKDKGG